MTNLNTTIKLSTITLALFCSAGAFSDQQILDDLIVDGSACIGFDCVNGESFGFDTIRIKENNLRIKAFDTSSTASFPTRDWQITFNETSNGGANKFSIDDIDGGRTPFTIEASAPSHSLYVDDGGRVGLGTSTPVVDIHTKSGNTPTLRLEQDGSSGFSPQTWDLAGNEANFFIRDATNGSTLPFRIFPGAPTDAITIEANTGDVGIGTRTPTAALHVKDSGNAGGDADVIIKSDSDKDAILGLGVAPNYSDAAGEDALIVAYNGNNGGNGFIGTRPASAAFPDGGQIIFAVENQTIMTLSTGGLNIDSGDLSVSGTDLIVPDYVFDNDYDLMSISDVAKFVAAEKHLPGIPSETEIQQGALGVASFQMKLLEKVEELTLYTISQEDQLRSLQTQMGCLNNRWKFCSVRVRTKPSRSETDVDTVWREFQKAMDISVRGLQAHIRCL